MFRVVLCLGLFRVVNGWVGFRVSLRVRVGFFLYWGFFLEIITFNVFSGTFLRWGRLLLISTLTDFFYRY